MRTEQAEIRIRGMMCRSCVKEVEELLLHTRGVLETKVAYAKGTATLRYDPELVSLEEIERRIRDGGYETGARTARDYALDGVCLALTVLLAWLLLHGKASAPALSEGSGFVAIFLAGLLTSPHCVGMCGGILLGQSAGSRSPALASSSYNAGRVLSYTLVGAIFGALGTVIRYTISVKSMVFTMLGLAVALLGLNMWGLLPGLRALFPEQNSACRLSVDTRGRFAGRPLVIGLLTGVMPCGPLYAMWLHAITGGSAAYGAMSMLAFSLGTVPLMLLFGAVGSILPKKWNKYLLKGSAVIVVAMGLKMLIRGLLLLR
ncbi:MAG: sulfite exporter TauE/SafE family protein [Clostridia bacterium]|nr:sulfite exporter TauE/SafE family protein [Clostridia bacterium]